MKLKRLPAVAAVAALGLAFTSSYAAPRAESAMECGIAADMAVVAHSLAREQIQRAKADAIMVRIYDVSESDRGKQLMRDIIDAAYSKDQASGASAGGTNSSQKFAEELFNTCMQSGGDMDPVLGKRS
jgi:lipopolysaccharide export LptBFGC system permease protein LptF